MAGIQESNTGVVVPKVKKVEGLEVVPRVTVWNFAAAFEGQQETPLIVRHASICALFPVPQVPPDEHHALMETVW